MKMLNLTDEVLEKVVGGASPKNNGVPGADALYDAFGTGITVYRVTNALGAPVAGNTITTPDAMLNAAQKL